MNRAAAIASAVAAGAALAVAAPEQIALNYGATPGDMVVTWVASGKEQQGLVYFGTSATDMSQSVATTGATYTIGSYTSAMIYKATVSGLTEGNKPYYYKVGSDSTGYSEVFQFKSHPGVGSGAVTFHVYGDLGQTENSVETLYEILDNEAALSTLSGGIVSMGDLSYANGDQPLWDSFGKMRQVASATIPTLTTLGNHEWFDDKSAAFTAYKARFDNPRVDGVEELYYSFDVGLAHWIMVAGYCQEMKSVNTQPCLAAGSKQLTWLQNDLASVNKSVTPWTFVVFHQPYVNSNTAHSMSSEGKPMQAAIEDTLYNSGIVDVVFSGHVHAYERSCQVYNYTCTSGAPYYITIGDGGNAEGLATGWVSPQPVWSIYRQASYGHGELVVFNETHTSWQWHQNKDLSPTIADEFVIVKGEGNQLKSFAGVGTTGQPVFADNERGRKAAQFNEDIKSVNFKWRSTNN